MSAEIITDPEELSRTEVRVGDLVTERVTDVGSGTDNGYYDGQVVRIEREPEPEPEWEPGTKGEATINGRKVGGFISESDGVRGFYYWNESAGHTSYTGAIPADFVPDEPRALPSVDQVAEAIRGVNEPDPPSVGQGEPLYLLGDRLAAERVLDLLRGESR